MSAALEVSADLVASMAEPVDVTGALCDCGEPKHEASEGCDRCSFLDGVTFDGGKRVHPREIGPMVIAALRVTERMTLRDLAVELYGASTATARRSLLRAVQKLERAGRVRRRWVERTDVERWNAFARGVVASQFVGAWGYELIGGGS